MKFLSNLRKFPYLWLIAVPVLSIFLGAASNQVVLVANHGKFPVMINDAFYAKFCTIPPDADPELIAMIPPIACLKGGQMIDEVHSIMGPNSHLKLLSDIFPLGDAIYSVGDGLINFGSWMLTFSPIAWLFLTMRRLYNLVD